jgi:hypothetical protein
MDVAISFYFLCQELLMIDALELRNGLKKKP